MKLAKKIAQATDKDNNITNNANLWASETMGNAKYTLELYLCSITVSLETMKLAEGLPGWILAKFKLSQ